MKTKFTQILKVKEQALNQAEALLLETRYKVNLIKDKIKKTYNEIISCNIPQSGEFAVINQTLLIKNILKRNKQDLEEQLVLLNNELQRVQKLYKNSKIDFEKIKYLEELEIEEILKKQKKKEQVFMDEIASIRHNFKENIL